MKNTPFKRNNKGLSSKSTLNTKGRINPISSKQKSISENLSKVYSNIDQKEKLYCRGCGTTTNLSHSHIIPRSRRRDLVTEPNNITLHCNRCHLIWEHGTLEELQSLQDFSKNLEYIKSVDLEYYNIINILRE